MVPANTSDVPHLRPGCLLFTCCPKLACCLTLALEVYQNWSGCAHGADEHTHSEFDHMQMCVSPPSP